MSIKVGINGFGRIGKLVFTAMMEQGGFEVKAINDLADAAMLAHLLKYDTAHGKFPGTVSSEGQNLIVNGTKIPVISEKNPANLKWDEKGVDIVIEATGIFRKKAADGKPGYDSHLQAGAKKVILTVPAKDEIDATIVLGVNDQVLENNPACLSNASCTTNCLAPIAKVLNDSFGIENGVMTTVHAFTNDQNTADQIHKDMRRSRAASWNIIPTTTGAAKAVGKVIPELDGKLNGGALRVPVITGSLVDLTVNLKKDTNAEAINSAMKAAAEGEMKGILSYTEDPIVSSDIIHDPHSSIFDAQSTLMMGGKTAKVMSWYDNEWGYSNRIVDLIKKVGS
ncbi:MAG TPA: type I glyceraldehyde-3-phosphate dehydrogenase [Spirochaetota bacterium]|nr:type I glyceraldehyde-3-phosphate dehydrogenase [Spirochaetota bacterium]